LILDIETAPSVAHVWGLFDQTVSLAQLQESSRVLCFAAKWVGNDKVEYRSTFHDGEDKMLKRIHTLLDEADATITYNGVEFDLPHLRREFLLSGLPPPSPTQDIDLLKAVKSRFKFVSNKLDYVSQRLGLGKKTKHEGHELWVKCMAGDKKAWACMREYNINDVILTEKVYEKLRAWIPNHPHFGGEACQRCGAEELQKRGLYRNTTGSFQRYQCQKCGSWSRGEKIKELKNHFRGIQ
jgi:uncharacterized protein YprB with RNaseH-like and TPR domain